MHKGTMFVLAGVAVAGGYFVGKATRSQTAALKDQPAATATANTPGADVERKKVPLEGNFKGAKDAVVSIVEFSDFQCPFCSRVVPTIHQLLKEYPDKVRVYFKHMPLPFHQDAPLASEASLAAEAQGKFWEYHDKLFENQQALKRPDLEKYAQDLGLDMAKFKKALDDRTYKARVDADMNLASRLGVQGTPNSFINGRAVEGAMPYESFKKIVDEELATAQKLIASGTPKAKVYDKLMESAGRAVAAQPQQPAAPQKPTPQVGSEVYKIAVGKAPTRGAKQPKVTIVTWSEFQCPFCSRVNGSLEQLLKDHGDDVQVAFKHFPLPMHQNAQMAGEAAEAAREQGKFWEMHDKMFANQQALDRPNLEKYAQELNLDLGKFKAALDGGKYKAQVEADLKEGQQFGVRGTPTSFINGRQFRGAQPVESFKAVVEEEIKKADEKLKGGVARKDLYAALTKDGLDKAAAPPAPAGEPQDGTVYKAEVKGAVATKGAKDALVTIVQFSDYQCPFCSRVEPTIDRVMDEYKGKVRVVWRDLPLPFHNNAVPAAIAARAAGDQGKFWEMHKKLFQNQQALDRPQLDKYAQELGLDMAKFKAAMESPKHKAGVEADTAMAGKIGARGTPAFFINGTFLSGAQPFESFKARIDEQLKKAEALVAKGTPKGKVYDALMKDAKAEAGGAPAAAAAAEAGPENDQKIYEVEPGNSPSRGPKNAAITMVIFSDFECPFCGKVEPTIAEVEKLYPGKVRVVWKNYPLDFHQNARPAAEAALAAGEQGKFWQYHDKLFANQRALDRASLEKYAQELGLDMGKFKAALDSKKFAAQVDAEFKEGQKIGVTGTPATFINGRMISGAYPIDTFKKVVDQELAKAKTGKPKRKMAAVN